MKTTLEKRPVVILMVEDNPTDVLIAGRFFRRQNAQHAARG